MTGEELEAVFRDRFADTKADYLISQSTFLGYLNEAQNEACLRANLLFGKSTISVLADKNDYIIDDSILALTYAAINNATPKTKLLITDRTELDRMNPNWRDATNGVPSVIIPYDTWIELAPTPNAAYLVDLEYFKYPDDPILLKTEPEIHKAHHLKLLDWVLFRVYSTREIEIYDPSKGKQYEADFIQSFGQRPYADLKKNEFTNTPHVTKPYLP